MKKHYLHLLTLVFFISSFANSLVWAQDTQNLTNPASDLKITLPLHEGSVKFIAFGDTGRGNKQQNELGQLMFKYHQSVPYDFVIMVGDNIYGTDKAEDMKKKFEDPYKPLLNAEVKFYAALGNHDDSNQRFYEFFNMKGEEYYRFTKGDVSFYALNSNYMDARQLKWMQDEFAKDPNKWRIAFFHHPLYSSGARRGPTEDLRDILEPVLLNNGFDVVFFGHDHFYERIKPQKGIYYFLTGAGGQISKDLKKNSPITDKGYDQDLSFTLLEIDKDEMYFQTITRTGETIDSGMIKRRD
jgi:predicted phosphodiesterase